MSFFPTENFNNFSNLKRVAFIVNIISDYSTALMGFSAHIITNFTPPQQKTSVLPQAILEEKDPFSQ
jgi:hypothetical protein